VAARFILVVLAVASFHFMLQLITILNRCHRFHGFVYSQARFCSDGKSIEIAVRPRKGSRPVCSRCHLPASGYDRLTERRFEFIPVWGYLVFLLYTMRRVDCPRCEAVVVEEVPWGDGKRTLTSVGEGSAITVKSVVILRYQRMIRTVKDLSADQKMAIESLLGRRVLEHEEISLRAIEPPTLSDERRREIAEDLRRYFSRVDAGRRPGSAEEAEEILTEAIRSSRPSYRPHQ